MNRLATLLVGSMLAATSIWAQAPNISYSQSSYTFPVGSAISPLTPANTGGAVAAPGSVGVVSTLAGNGSQAYADGTGTAASFKSPYGVAVDGSGNVYVADQINSRIRKISPAGVVSTLAGSGSYAYADGTGAAASFNLPTGVAVDGSGNVYVADYNNHRIRKISPAGVVTTLAGNGCTQVINGVTYGCYADGTGTAASFNGPTGVAVDGSGNVYVADNGNHRIRKISPSGVVSTLAGSGCTQVISGATYGCYADGTGAAASFNYPSGVAVDGSGNVYVADRHNNRIRKISPAGVVTTLAGSVIGGYADGTGTAASFNLPFGVAVDVSGNVYVADQYGHRIRKISPAGVVTTLAGSGIQGFADGTGTAASFYNPAGVAVDGSGNVYVADLNNHRIRKISQGGYTVSPALPSGLSLNATTGVISGTPTVTTPATSYVVTATNAGGSSSFTITINTAGQNIVGPTITSLSPTNTYCAGGAIAIIFTASGFGTANVFTAQLSNSTGSFAAPVTLGTLTGANGGTITATLSSSQAAGTGYRIRIVASNPATTGANNGTNLTINALPSSAQATISTSGSTSICPGSSVVLSVPNTAGFTYQWLLAGSPITGATSFSYTASVAGAYAVTVTNAAGCSRTSANRTVSILTAPAAFITPSATQTFTGSPITLSANTATGLTYQWRLNGNAITGATASTYSVTAIGSYSVTVTNSGGCATTSNSVLVQAATTGATVSGTGTRTKCAGDTLQVAFTGTGFNTGNAFTLQLSDAAGSFANPQSIGTLAATTSGIITGTIPANTPAGNGYKLRINSSNPATTGAASALTIQVRTPITDTVRLCAVTVDSATGQNRLVWNKPVSINIDSFVVYRGTATPGQFVRVAAQANAGVLSSFTDTGANPAVRAWRYYVSGKNACGETGNAGTHKTMHLTINAGQTANIWNLIWNGYEGLPQGTYGIWRGASAATMTLVAEVEAGSYNSYTDLTAPSGNVFYQVRMGGGPICNPTLRTTGEGLWIASNIATNAKEGATPDWADMSVYPNPSREGAQLLIQSSKADEVYAVRVMDVAGRVLLETKAAAGQVVTFGADLAAGLYTIQATSASSRMVKQWVKQ